MPSRAVDNAVRVLLGAVGIVSVVLVFVVHDATTDWPAISRLLATIPLAGVGVYGLAVISELSNKHENRDMLRFPRLGRRRIKVANAGSLSSRAIKRPTVLTHAPTDRFSSRISNSLIALGIGLLVAVSAWFGSLGGLQHADDISEGLVVWLMLLPLGIYLTARSLIRIVMAGRTVVVGASGVTLGIPLGFSWPVQISFDDIAVILILETDPGPEYLIITTSDRSYHVDGGHLNDGPGLSDWIDRNIANSTVGAIHETAFAEPEPTLAKPIATPSGTGPSSEILDNARHVLARRIRRMAVLLAVAIAFTSFVAWAYLSLRAENQQVEATGTRFVAELFKVVDSSRGAPGELHVRLESGQTSIERIIYSGWFREFDPDVEGADIVVLFDPLTEGIAKLPGQTNYPTWLGIGFLVAAVLLAVGGLGFWGSRQQPAVLQRNSWERVRISMESKTNAPLLLRRNQDDHDHALRGVLGKGRSTFVNHGAWLATDDRNLAVLPDDSERVLTTTVPKQSVLRDNPLPTLPR